MDDQQPKNGSSKASLEDIKDFDYSPVPNPLDENMDSVQGKARDPGRSEKLEIRVKAQRSLMVAFQVLQRLEMSPSPVIGQSRVYNIRTRCNHIAFV
ncbi:hypothetical protein FRC03_011799 [Tulasnella sp. 419]|nr:hypothetical protein FRC03_011799 [Tulasnella sp. 419]